MLVLSRKVEGRQNNSLSRCRPEAANLEIPGIPFFLCEFSHSLLITISSETSRLVCSDCSHSDDLGHYEPGCT